MKINLKKVFILIFCLILGLVTVLAAPDPPPPPNGRNQEGAPPPPPPGLPIDEYIPFFIVIAVAFGIYSIHANTKKI